MWTLLAGGPADVLCPVAECIESLGFGGTFVCHDCQEKRQQTMKQNLKNAGQLRAAGRITTA